MLGSSSTTRARRASVTVFSPFVHGAFIAAQSNLLEGDANMNATVTRMAVTLGAGLIALGVSAGAYVHAQDQNTNPQAPPFRGRGLGPGGPGRGPGGPMGMLPMLGPWLALTDAQKDQVKAIADTHKDEWKALADRGRTAHLALDAAIAADTVDDALIRQK